MAEFIFHIGMHKCASCTLQQDLFKYEPGSLGTYPGLPDDLNFAKQFQRLVPVGGRQFGDLKETSNWLERVVDYYKENSPGLERFIVSSELLCQSNKLSKRPIIPFLKRFDNEILQDGTTKVIIVFRNQADMLASAYAQNSGVNFKASQDDFEKWVFKKMNAKGKSQLDWGSWTQELVAAFGRQNVCVLLLEEIQTIGFWEDLVSFIETKKFSATELKEKIVTSIRNKRTIDEKTWGLSPFNLDRKADVDINKIFNFIWSAGKFQSFRNDLKDTSIEMRKKYLHLRGYKDGALIDPVITLDSALRSEIQSNFRKSNDVLAEKLGKDLSNLGYF